MSAERIEALLALAALGELTEAEEAELDVALADDTTLVAELDADGDVAARLQSVHAEAAPAKMRDRVLAAVADTRQDAVVASPDVANHDVGEVTSFDSAPSRRAARLWRPLAAVAAVVALVVGAATVFTGTDDAGPTFATISSADDAVERELDGILDGDLRVVFSADAGGSVLDGVDVAALPAGETFQLWLMDDTGAMSVGVFVPDDSGRVVEVFDDLDPSDFMLAVTIEPAGGSDEPTLPIIASA